MIYSIGIVSSVQLVNTDSVPENFANKYTEQHELGFQSDFVSMTLYFIIVPP